MILVTGAGGTVGSALVRELGERSVPLRAGFFSAQKVMDARVRGTDAAVIDFHNPQTVREALAGCDAMFLLAPSVTDQTEMELAAMKAAREAGVRRIVKQSVMGAEGGDYSLSLVHRPVEQAIEASGMEWTHLRPNSFMQNVVTYMGDSIRGESAFYTASPGARISHVDVRDIARVAARALVDPGHGGKAYDLTGPRALDHEEMARVLSDVLGRPVHHVGLTPEEMRQGMLGIGMPEDIADRMLDLERYFREDRASRVTDDVRQVTGREPGRFEDYVREHAPLLRAEEAPPPVASDCEDACTLGA